MEFFRNAKTVRLRSHHDKYLLADEDEEDVCQDRNGSSKRAKWEVECVEINNVIRLKSCYGKYLTASSVHFLLGTAGKKVLQTVPPRLDSSVEWEPIRDGFQVKLKTRYGNFLRANGGLPPWRNSITHDIPHRTATQDWVLWEIDVTEIKTQTQTSRPPVLSVDLSDSLESEFDKSLIIQIKSPRMSMPESSDPSAGTPGKADGRVIYYHVADENGDVDDTTEEFSFIFKGNEVEELTQKLEEETGLKDIVVCSRNPLNQKVYPLKLQLPPNNVAMHVVMVPSDSKAVGEFGSPRNPGLS
ncbi:hypothetical protein VitviT2T_022560 [Vitis vinifera]|nr:hypothetical protein VitviT2T_022560 [Vitis vinifera]